ncbi:MAG: TonB-dependent receptor plug domain-containing protein, partial [Phocaeicola sp.]
MRIYYLLIAWVSLFGTVSLLNAQSVEHPSKAIKEETLHKDSLYLPEVVVTGSRNAVDVRHLPMSVTVINSQQIKKRYEQSLLPLLTEQVPGLFTTVRGIMGYGVSTGASGGMSMRGVGGSPTTGMLILIDGHPQYMGLMGHPIADAYQSMLAEKVEVVRGPGSVIYGSNAMGGVIHIITQKHQTDGFKGNARLAYGSFNSLTSEVSGRYRKGGFSSLITGSYNRTDGHREHMEFEQYGGYAKVGYEFSNRWNLFADFNLTHFNASNPGTESRPIFDNDSRITRGMSSFSLENNYERTSGAFKFFYNFGKHVIDDGYYANEPLRDYLFSSKDQMFGMAWYQSFAFFSGNRSTVGVDYQRFGGEAWNAYHSGDRSDIIDKGVNNLAGYIDLRQQLGRYITLDAGLRVDYHTISGTHLIPQLGASIYPIERGEIKLLASRGFRNPTIREMYMFPPQNPHLVPESLWNYELSWSQRLLEARLSYSLNLYYIKGENMIQTVQVDGRPLNMNTGMIENWGGEAAVSYRMLPGLLIHANYSYLHAEHPVLAAPKHKLYAGVDFSKGCWSVSTGV